MDPRASFQMPPLVNSPPCIFGGYSPVDGISGPGPGPDGSTGSAAAAFGVDLAAVTAGMFGDAALLDDLNESKRRRIARACDMCRKKKIKCDGKLPCCTHCVNYKTDCVFTQVEKKRSPPKGAKYVEGLENRLGRMENLLRLSGLLDDGDGATDLAILEKKLAEKQQSKKLQDGTGAAAASSPSLPDHKAAYMSTTTQSESHTVAHESPADSSTAATTATATCSTNSGSPAEDSKIRPTSPDADGQSKERDPGGHPHEEVEALSEMMCSLVSNQSGETRYIGSSSGFSIFSPKGIEWVNQKTGDNSFQRMITDVSIDDHKWTAWKPEVFGDLFPRPIFRALPNKADAMSLFKDYFENFNCMFPLFHQPTFMHLVERHYSGDPHQGSGWWASINVVLAIANRLRVMSNLVPADNDCIAWDYLKNAMAVLSELVMRNADLLSVQALLGMALFMQGTPNPQPSTLLIAMAIRLSHSIGLHKRGTGFNLNPIEIEQRKRVFWIAYMLDKDLSLRSGRPPAQDDDDMNVELPDADPADNIGNIPLADGVSKMNLFRLMCEFACIESKVYKKLYATKATKQSDGEYLNVIGKLDKELEDWKNSIPIDFRPEYEIKASHTPLILHVVMLHFSYYNCLTTIHRMSIHHGYWTSRLSNYAIQGLNSKPINPRIFSSAALCTSAARASISLIKYVPQGDNSCVWMILYFPVSALVTLFGNILQNPLDPKAKSDCRLMNMVVTFLSMLGHEAETGGVHRMLGVCSEFERIAKLVIENAEKGHVSRRKRKSHDGSARSGPSSGARQPFPSGQTSFMSPLQSQPMPHQPYNQQPQQQPQPQQQQQNFKYPHSNRQSLTPDMAYAAQQATSGNFMDAISPMSGGWQRDFCLTPDSASSGGGGGSASGANTEFTASMGASIGGSGNTQSESPSMGTIDGGAAMRADFQFQMPAQLFAQQHQQPLIPQDLYSLPISLDWAWAEMSGGAYPTVENGNFHGMGGM
ncbi:hypothetical protein Cpir12675_005255 [Ceratocystis pirilliformis]|uniref:Zn(2)-C6 fungal-type domain-containing protein n=1 Tax=Ceratocystis pirilliformis TaxID=259994 RepID=A0ABR3YR26_9PEZI